MPIGPGAIRPRRTHARLAASCNTARPAANSATSNASASQALPHCRPFTMRSAAAMRSSRRAKNARPRGFRRAPRPARCACGCATTLRATGAPGTSDSHTVRSSCHTAHSTSVGLDTFGAAGPPARAARAVHRRRSTASPSCVDIVSGCSARCWPVPSATPTVRIAGQSTACAASCTAASRLPSVCCASASHARASSSVQTSALAARPRASRETRDAHRLRVAPRHRPRRAPAPTLTSAPVQSSSPVITISMQIRRRPAPPVPAKPCEPSVPGLLPGMRISTDPPRGEQRHGLRGGEDLVPRTRVGAVDEEHFALGEALAVRAAARMASAASPWLSAVRRPRAGKPGPGRVAAPWRQAFRCGFQAGYYSRNRLLRGSLRHADPIRTHRRPANCPRTSSTRMTQITALSRYPPRAPVHILIVPNKPIPTANDIADADATLIGRLVPGRARPGEKAGHRHGRLSPADQLQCARRAGGVSPASAPDRRRTSGLR